MIGSFWNLCRACPAMPIDKLHSEYRSTYTWHEYTGPNQEHTVVRRAPQPPPRASLEPPLPRRKKCPELAYRTHEFIAAAAADAGGIDALDSNVVADKVREVAKVLPASHLSKAITRISTEYRLQFAWPRRQQLTNGDLSAAGKELEAAGDYNGHLQQQQQQHARKSVSMGALRQGSIIAPPAPVHKRRQQLAVDHRRHGRDGAQASELEPLVAVDGAVAEGEEHEEPEERDEADGNAVTRKPGGRAVRLTEPQEAGKSRKTQERPFSATEVIELRRELKRLADEYKHRDWGGGMASEDEATLWSRVSNNHALNALSLARSATKEEKEKENTRKVGPGAAQAVQPGQQPAPTAPAGRPSSVQARPLHGLLASEELKPDNDRALARARKDFLIRHHLDRTTGVGDGALLPSPTREKLEPATPRRREDPEIQPRPKPSPKSSPRSARSQSVGPAAAIERRSPKRHPQRPPSVARDAKDRDKEMREKSSERERHPRPSAVSRWKSREAGARLRSRSESTTRNRRGPLPSSAPSKLTAEPRVNGQPPPQPEQQLQQQQQQQQQQRAWIDDEPVVKSPPEPTRVKSPEQMIMRSPEPVNWTVPLDTGKTFTVTQNVREGEPGTRAHSEARSWAGAELGGGRHPPRSTELKQPPPPQPQPQSGYKSPESESVSLGSFGGTNGHKEDSPLERDSPLPSLPTVLPTALPTALPNLPPKDEVPGEADCLNEPVFEFESKAKTEAAPPPQEQHHASDLLEKARNRFDKFWGSGKGSEQ